MIRLSRYYEIQSILADEGHMDAVKDLDEMIDTQKKMVHIKEMLNEEHMASNAKVAAIKCIVNGDKDEISRFFG